jgi:Zn finger protein HypA/HybF involved in hydrogenase expression
VNLKSRRGSGKNGSSLFWKSYRNKEKLVDVQVCPKCKSPRVRRVKTMSGDLWSHLEWTPPKFECEECGWQRRVVLKATNKRLSVKDVEIIAEASDSESPRQ